MPDYVSWVCHLLDLEFVAEEVGGFGFVEDCRFHLYGFE